MEHAYMCKLPGSSATLSSGARNDASLFLRISLSPDVSKPQCSSSLSSSASCSTAIPCHCICTGTLTLLEPMSTRSIKAPESMANVSVSDWIVWTGKLSQWTQVEGCVTSSSHCQRWADVPTVSECTAMIGSILMLGCRSSTISTIRSAAADLNKS